MILLTLFKPIEHPIDFYKMKLGLCIVYIMIKRSQVKIKKKKINVWPKNGGALTTKERT